MPKLDAYIPEGALSPEAEKTLMKQLTDILLQEEGADASNAMARAIAWVTVHRPQLQLVGGEVPDRPRYQEIPEGLMETAMQAGSGSSQVRSRRAPGAATAVSLASRTSRPSSSETPRRVPPMPSVSSPRARRSATRFTAEATLHGEDFDKPLALFDRPHGRPARR
jgi:hypothetical protein